MKQQQNELKTSGKMSSDRLTTLERQFNRIEEFDSKMLAVQLQLEQSNAKLEQLAKEKRFIEQFGRPYQENILTICGNERQHTSHNGKSAHNVIHYVGHEESIQTIISVYNSISR
jgi:hypothetical protein